MHSAAAASTVAASGRLLAPELFSPARHLRPRAVGRDDYPFNELYKFACRSLSTFVVTRDARGLAFTFLATESGCTCIGVESPDNLGRGSAALPERADKIREQGGWPMVFEKQSSKTVGLGAVGTTDVRSLYDQCSASEKAVTRGVVRGAKNAPRTRVYFPWTDLRYFCKRMTLPPLQDSQLAARHDLLLAVFREVTCADDRLRIFAQWLWAELNIRPEDSLGEELKTRLTLTVLKRVNKIPWNDFYCNSGGNLAAL